LLLKVGVVYEALEDTNVVKAASEYHLKVTVIPLVADNAAVFTHFILIY
jgi:hypothetical protein